jgi:uncharacterized membrane protein (DUF106 family)
VSEPALASADAAPETPTPAAPLRPRPTFKLSTFLLTFLFVMGIYMLFSSDFRLQVANSIGYVLVPVIGFNQQYLLLTMFLAAVLEMLATAIAYNATTDWVKAARAQSWGAAFRKVQMEALRSGKKDRIEAIKPHQTRLNQLSTEVSIAQLKGMAVTWFLVIAIYTWVGLFILSANAGAPTTAPCPASGAMGACVTIGGGAVNLLAPAGGVAFLPLWFLIFSLYTIPSSIALRRVLKHVWLRRYAAARPDVPSAPVAGGGA